MSGIINLLLAIGVKLGHSGVFFLMTIESSFLPMPSEIIIPPAAYLAQKGELNIWLVIIAGTFGSCLGATINYLIGLTLGRKIIYGLAKTRYAKILLINENRIQRAENYFLQYGNAATFIGRLVPGIRHLISLPAGFIKMPFVNFLTFTFLGSAIWVTVLAILGYLFGANENLIKEYYHEISIAGLFLALGFVIYLGRKNKKS
ncbi:MAG: DedA family protein [Candidatus Falkowbacteria bacterium]|nr:DedA family protein [Candidatus Falkowbacteria bacterium]